MQRRGVEGKKEAEGQNSDGEVHCRRQVFRGTDSGDGRATGSLRTLPRTVWGIHSLTGSSFKTKESEE